MSTMESQIEFETILGKVWNRNDQSFANAASFGGKMASVDEKKQEQKLKADAHRKAYENAGDSVKIKQLDEMFGIGVSVAKFAYDTHGYEEAIVKLTDPTERQSIVAMAKSLQETQDKNNAASLDKVSDFFNSYSQSNASSSSSNNNNNNSSNNNNNNNSGGGSNLGGKVKSWFSKNSNNNNNNESKSNDNDFKMSDFDEKFLDIVSVIKRTQSDNTVQQCKKEHLIRTIASMSKHNWLLQVLCFGLKVLLNGNKFCMICEKPLVFAGLKPSICDKEICQFRHDEMGLGFSLADEIINKPDLVDLLISMCYASCKANRYQDFFPYGVRADTITTPSQTPSMKTIGSTDPFADVSETSNTNTTTTSSSTTTTSSVTNTTATAASSITDTYSTFGNEFADMDSFLTGGTADPSKVIAVIDLCPEVTELQGWAMKGKRFLKEKCFLVHPLLYHFLSWVITSNRSHLKLLKESERVKGVDTEWQFALCSSTPAREAQFQRLQFTNGSFLAWHGSAFGNWHSILRMGLKNYSGTKHQSNGAAYGSGIYLAANFSYSWAYSQRGAVQAWSKSRYGSNLVVMALCEVCYHQRDAHKHRNKIKNSASAVNLKNIQPVASSSNKNTTSTTSSTSTTTSTSSKTTTTTTRNTYGRRNLEGAADNKWLKTNGIYVVDSEEHVVTRFFFVFPNTGGYNSHGKNQEANSLKIPQVVKTFD